MARLSIDSIFAILSKLLILVNALTNEPYGVLGFWGPF